MKISQPVSDFSSVRTLIYHLPGGKILSISAEDLEDFLDFELEQGHICDTSDIDGVVHFFPTGNA